jgi:hypothetical protein
MDEQIVMNWYPNSSPDRMTGYGSIVGRMTLAEIADWCATHGIDPTVVTVNGNVRTSRRYTDRRADGTGTTPPCVRRTQPRLGNQDSATSCGEVPRDARRQPRMSGSSRPF